VLHRCRSWIALIARCGYTARAIMYFLIGGLAVLAALGQDSRATGVTGALRRTLTSLPGKGIVAFVVIGLTAHALWSLLLAFRDPERRARTRSQDPAARTPAARFGYRFARFFEALVQVVIVAGAVGMVTGWTDGGPEDESNIERWSATLLSFPLGPFLLGGIGVGMGLFGVAEILRGYRARLDEMLRLAELAPKPRWVVTLISRLGIAARGIVFGLIGVWIIAAAVTTDARTAKGLGGALRSLQAQPAGPLLLSIVAAGLVAYGTYELARARYRRIQPATGSLDVCPA